MNNNIMKNENLSFKRPPLFSDEMAKLCEDFNKLALEADRNNVEARLDYSLESVEFVEEFLGRLHEVYISTPNTEWLSSLAMAFGAYIIQVIELNFSHGVWEQDDTAQGPAMFPYYWEGTMLLPVSWCGDRIFIGPEGNNVWEKFNALVVEHQRRTLH